MESHDSADRGSSDDTSGGSADAASLNRALVDALVKSRHIVFPRIEAAFRKIHRHLFLPDLPLETVYRDEAIMTRVEGNIPLSSSSQPAMMAIMLEQLDLQPGERVLEIGTATGYNAAIMSELVGPEGKIVSVDIDAELVDEAKRNLARAGVENVSAFAADGGYGYPEEAPYDAIILTVGSWDIASAWREQLAPNGRLLLPLALFGDYQESVLFRNEGDHLASRSHYCCSFIRLRGAFAGPEGATLEIAPGLTLHLDSDDHRTFEPEVIRSMLDARGSDLPSGVALSPRVVHHRLLRALTARFADLCAINAVGDQVDSGIIPRLFHSPGKQSTTFGLLDDRSMALLYGSPTGDPPETPGDQPLEIGATCYGEGDHLGRLLVDEIIRWNAAGRPCEDPDLTIRAYPKDHPYMAQPGERVIEKEQSKIVLSRKSGSRESADEE